MYVSTAWQEFSFNISISKVQSIPKKNMVIQKRHGNSTNVSQMLIEEFGRTTDMFLAWCSNTKFEIGLVDFYRESFVSR